MASTSNTCVQCSCIVCTEVRRNLNEIYRVLDIYGWLLDSYIVDFFLEDSWKKLPRNWQSTLDVVSPKELGKWISGESCQRVWPLSLMALRKVIQSLEINRNHNKKEVIECYKRRNNESNNLNSLVKLNLGNSSSLISDSKLNNLFMKHVKKKKRYEIEKMTQILEKCARNSNCNCVVDIGAGMGHLARVLAFRYGFSITCVEQDSLLTAQAEKCDKEVFTYLKKYNSTCEGSLQHVSMSVSAKDSGIGLVNYLLKSFSNESSLSKTEGFGLVGLHPCGDLATTLLRIYSLHKEAKFICIVGCCYMKLTLSDNESVLKGYPMSQYVSKLVNHKLSFNALEVSCHAVEKHCDKLKEEEYTDLVVHTYRAVLEYILVQKSSELRRIKVKSVKVKDGMSFEQYCKIATADLEPEKQPQLSEFTRPKVLEFLNQWNRVLVFGSLRLMLAPLVETCVLLDRFLFLSEKGLFPSLKAEFDCRVSPRNFVLVSSK